MTGILLVSPERWTDHFVSKHHYAMTLAGMGAKVLFVDPPTSDSKETRLTPVAGHPNLFVVTGPRVAAGLRFFPRKPRQKLERRWLEALERQAGFAISVVWLFENSRFFDMGFAGSRLKIYHQVDLNQRFNMRKAAASADICLCTTDIIRQELSRWNTAVYKIHHGLAHVAAPMPLEQTQLSLISPDAVNAAYVGNLDMTYLDWGLLKAVVEQHPRVRFHFAGGYNEQKPLRRNLREAANVVWWGRVDYRQIPSLLERMDILLVAYQRDRFRDQASPHKLMEYLASGKVTVATYTDEYKDKRHLLEMTERDGDFKSLFARVVSRPRDFNQPEKQAQRRQFARDHTYSTQLMRIESLLSKRGFSLHLPRAQGLERSTA